jgi:hypothetical protein
LGLVNYTAAMANPIAPSPQQHHQEFLVTFSLIMSSLLKLCFWAEIKISIYLSIYLLFQKHIWPSFDFLITIPPRFFELKKKKYSQ